MGADAFGIHTENFALTINKHPIDVTKENITNFREQLKKL
jgi:leucyl-tRNA synthetase